MLVVLGRSCQVNRRRRGHHDGLTRAKDGGYPARGLWLVAVPRPRFKGEALFCWINVRTRLTSNPSVLTHYVKRAEVAEQGNGKPRDARKHALLLQRRAK